MIQDTQDPKDSEYFRVQNIVDADPKKTLNDKYANDQNILVIDEATKFIGNTANTIKIVKNFMGLEELALINKLCDHFYKEENIDELDMIKSQGLILSYRDKIKNKAENLFKLRLEHDSDANKYNIKSFYLNGRIPYFATNIHTDVLTDRENNNKYMWSGHISNLLYLNDNYVGGELYFPHHDLIIKPEAGMLISFPGNWYNRHGIMPANDFRYAINIFIKVINFPNYLEYK